MIYFTTCTDLTNLVLLVMHIVMKRLGNIFCIWPSEWNHSAIYQIHYAGVTWVLWRLESLATVLNVQQLLQANTYEDKMSILPAFCEWNPPVTCGECSVILIEIIQKSIPGEKAIFSDGLFY